MTKRTRPVPLPSRATAFTLACLLALFAGTPAAANINIANAPLFLTTSVDPNVVFVIDDSGSMQWETMPDDITKKFSTTLARYVMWTFPRAHDTIHGGTAQYDNERTVSFNHLNTTAFFRSAHNNTVYYNPAFTYRPWSNPDGTLMTNADPEAAPNRPLFPEFGTRNLTVDNTQRAPWINDTNGNSSSISSTWQTFYPALYYHYVGGSVDNRNSYERVEIRSTTGTYVGHGRENRDDCKDKANATCTYAEEIQNFANWYSYHRNRIFASRAGIGAAFAAQPGNLRVGYGAINKGASTVDGQSTSTVVRGVRPFAGADRESFFTQLYERPVPAAGTPLRNALKGVGEYYKRTDNRGPWSTTPGSSGGTDLSCRQSFTILMSDGYWNGSNPNVGNQDGQGNTSWSGPDGSGGTITGGYEVSAPFSDGHSNTLADVAMAYWKQDLHPDLENRVPHDERNPAFWQHMVTYTVGLGVEGSISAEKAFAAISDPSISIDDWPSPHPSDADPEKIDDMLHAAVNSRGGFFSAADPETFAKELARVLEDILGRVETSSTSAAASSAVLQEDTRLYRTGFRSGDWSGSFEALALNSDGSTSGQIWDAEKELRKLVGSRKIITTNSAGNGIPFTFDALSSDQQAALNRGPDGTLDDLGPARVAWLQGHENAHPSFRSRSESHPARLMGDIINSNPQFVGKTYNGFGRLLGAPGNRDRVRAIYVGANNGMLHAFNADDGKELFAFIPGQLLTAPAGSPSPLNHLMDEDYTHRYYMDGTPLVEEAQIGAGNTWRTVLVSSMGAGGRTMFALDVTDPTAFNTGHVLWEFTDPDLGYNVGQPTIARLGDGTWVAIFGNGYNSATHRAFLFVVDLKDGTLIRKIDTGVGSGGNPNGLAIPRWTDWPSQNNALGRVYAGDLLGNMWRFDVADSNPGQWNAGKLFTATDADGNPQPITSAPALALARDSDDILVVFGTGSYFRVQDGGAAGNQEQSFYGIIDSNTPVSGRSQLLMQEITAQGSHSVGNHSYALRNISDNELAGNHRGWYLDLDWSIGERVLTAPTVVAQSRVRFATMIPNSDPCGIGRSGFLYDLDLFTGGRFRKAVFDLNRDRKFDDADLWKDGDPPSAVGQGGGEQRTVIFDGPIDYIYGGDGGDGGEGNKIDGRGVSSPGRQSWRQLR